MAQHTDPANRKRRTTLAAVTLSLAVVISGILLAEPQERSVKLLFDCATLVAVIVGTAVAYTQLALLVDQRRDEHVKSLRDGALWYSFSGHPEVSKALDVLDRQYKGKHSPSKPVEAQTIREDREAKEAMAVVLAHWERMARALFAEAADERMAYESFGTYIVDFYEMYGPYIEEAGPGENPRAFEYLRALYPFWKGRRAEERAREEPYYVRNHPPRWYVDYKRRTL